MKIVHTEASMGFGGQELRILNEMKGMSLRGHELILICPEEAEIYRLAKEWGLKVISLPIGKKRWSGIKVLRKWIVEHKPDVINTHSSVDSWLVGLATYIMKDRPKIVRTRHISAPISKNITSRWLYTKLCDHVVTTGENLRQTLIKENGFAHNRVTSVRTGIDLARFKVGSRTLARQQLGLDQDNVYIGIIATLRSWKGHSYLIDAIADLPLNNQVKLVVVGDGPQYQNLKLQVEKLNLTERIIFVGRQNNIEQWMQAMDIFCLPSYANEGVPQSLMQAQACGLPAITTMVGSIEEAVIPDETAIIIKPKDKVTLKNALNVLITDVKKRQEMGKAAAENAAANFSEQNMLANMELVFRQ